MSLPSIRHTPNPIMGILKPLLRVIAISSEMNSHTLCDLVIVFEF